jgi:hypothetical protein
MDCVLHAERRQQPWLKQTHRALLETLPDGTFVADGDTAWLVRGDTLHAWSNDGYQARRTRPRRLEVTVLTPPSIVGVIRAGYPVGVHPSATA